MLSAKYSSLFPAFLSPFLLLLSSSLQEKAALSSYKCCLFLAEAWKICRDYYSGFSFLMLNVLCDSVDWKSKIWQTTRWRIAIIVLYLLLELRCHASEKGGWSAFACVVVGVSLAGERYRHWGGSLLCLHWLARAFLYRESSTLPKEKLPRRRGKAADE